MEDLTSLTNFISLTPKWTESEEIYQPEPSHFSACREYGKNLMESVLSHAIASISHDVMMVSSAFLNPLLPWSSDDLCNLSEDVLNAANRLQNPSISEYLIKNCEDPVDQECPNWSRLQKLLRPWLSVTVQSPALQIYLYCLKNTPHPHASCLVLRALPTCLRLLEAAQVDLQLEGVTCVQALLEGAVSPAVLNLGRGDLLYASLKQRLYSREPKLIARLLPSLIDLLRRMEPHIEQLQQCKHDELMYLLLYNLALESGLEMRRVLSSGLQLAITSLGTRVLLHMPRLLDVLRDGLTGSLSADSLTRLNLLQCIPLLVSCTRPFVRHSALFLQLCLCCIYDLDQDFCNKSVDKQLVVAECVKCISLLCKHDKLLLDVLKQTSEQEELPQQYRDTVSSTYQALRELE